MAEAQIVNIRGIKKLASEKLPTNSHLRELILQEPDEINVESFPIKLGLWLRLNSIENRAAAIANRGRPTPNRTKGEVSPRATTTKTNPRGGPR